MHVFTRWSFELPEAKHPIYGGTSAGDLIGPIALEPFPGRAWQVTTETKKKLYTSNFRIAVGGQTPDQGVAASEEQTAEGSSVKRPQWKGSEVTRKKGLDQAALYEPMAFHGLPPDFYKDFLGVFLPKAVVDFTACDMTFAFACIEARIPFLGVCFSEAHMNAAYQHLADLVYENMANETSPLHDSKLCLLLKDPKAKTATKRKNKTDEDDAGETSGKDGNDQSEGQGNDGKDTETKKIEPDPKKPRGASKTGAGEASGKGGSSIETLMKQLQGLRSGSASTASPSAA